MCPDEPIYDNIYNFIDSDVNFTANHFQYLIYIAGVIFSYIYNGKFMKFFSLQETKESINNPTELETFLPQDGTNTNGVSATK